MGIGTLNISENTGLAIRVHIHHASESKALGRPDFIVTELETLQIENSHSFEPLPYFTDAIVGLSAFKLLIHSRGSLASNEEALATLLWQKLEPMHEVYHRSHQRVKSLLVNNNQINSIEQNFDKSLLEILKASCTPKGTNLNELLQIISTLNNLEEKRSHPLLFDTQLQLSDSIIGILHTIYSLLYNLRALTAINYNEHCNDTLYETLQIDSVKDYFHAPDLLTNDTMLYLKIKNLNKKDILKGEANEHVQKALQEHLPHSYYLAKSLPELFFKNCSSEQIEEKLYTFQIDWLLGSPAGLLYRIREELIGLKEGYQNTFWPELQNQENENRLGTLNIKCILGSSHLRQLSEVA